MEEGEERGRRRRRREKLSRTGQKLTSVSFKHNPSFHCSDWLSFTSQEPRKPIQSFSKH